MPQEARNRHLASRTVDNCVPVGRSHTKTSDERPADASRPCCGAAASAMTQSVCCTRLNVHCPADPARHSRTVASLEHVASTLSSTSATSFTQSVWPSNDASTSG